MKRTIAAGLFTLCAWNVFSQPDYSKLFKKCVPAILKIGTVNSTGTSSEGTGFFIDSKGTAVTCHHVLDQAYKIVLMDSKGKRYDIDTILASNKTLDLIIFRVKLSKNEKTKYVKLAKDFPETGSAAVAIGCPGDYDFSITSGIIAGMRMVEGQLLLQHTAPCYHGSSGGPLMNKKGEVTGVMRFIEFEGQNLNFATSALYINGLKDDNTIQKILPQKFTLNKQQVDSIQKYADALFKAADYKATHNFLSPNLQYFQGDTLIENMKTLGDCYFFCMTM